MLLLLLFISSIQFTALGQTCSGTEIFTTQQQVTDFFTSGNGAGCTTFTGDLFFNDASITDFSLASNLTTVTGFVTIQNSNATNFNGFHNITSIGTDLAIINAPNITDMTGFDALTSIGDDFIFQNNDAVTSFAGLENLTTIGGYANIPENASLVDFTGLNNLTSIGEYLWIDDNDAMTSLNGLGSLASLGGYLKVELNDALTTLAGLDVLDYTTITDLIITSNTTLATCEISAVCSYIDNAGTNTISGNGANCADLTAVTNACALLPVELISFTVIAKGETAILNWVTASEENNEGFAVERSVDGRDWETLEFVAGQGDTKVLTHYEVVDADVSTPVVYYRLNQMDYDGHSTYSDIQVVRINDKNTLEVYPNPAKDVLYIQGLTANQATILDMLGQEMTVPVVQGEIDIQDLKTGLYLLQIGTAQVKFIKD